MSIIIENEYEGEINIPYEKIAHEVIEAAIDYVDCPYECEVNLMLTDNDTIHEINKEQREIDRPTDVLSFPMAEYEHPADFSKIEEDPMAFDPESGEFLLGILRYPAGGTTKYGNSVENSMDTALRENMHFDRTQKESHICLDMTIWKRKNEKIWKNVRKRF